MYSKSKYHPRRTRLYGSSYDIGESYYKHAIDNLDKNTKRISFSDTPNEQSNSSIFKREGSSTEITIPQLGSRKSYANNGDCLRVQTENLPIKFLSKKLRDFHQENAFTNLAVAHESRKEAHCGSKELSLFAESNNLKNDRLVKNSVNQMSGNFGFEEDFTKTNASLRAKATKTRLADLESEMLQLSEKQNERDKRNLNLKKLLSKSNSDD